MPISEPGQCRGTRGRGESPGTPDAANALTRLCAAADSAYTAKMSESIVYLPNADKEVVIVKMGPYRLLACGLPGDGHGTELRVHTLSELQDCAAFELERSLEKLYTLNEVHAYEARRGDVCR